jgi:hypothetical protein
MVVAMGGALCGGHGLNRRQLAFGLKPDGLGLVFWLAATSPNRPSAERDGLMGRGHLACRMGMDEVAVVVVFHRGEELGRSWVCPKRLRPSIR